jgi:hypothetical protein
MAAATKLAMTSAVPAGRAALLTVEEVAELRKVPVSWVYERTRSRGVNRIPGFRLANTGAFRRRRYLTGSSVSGPGAARTDWEFVGAEYVQRRLRTLGWLRDFTMACGDSIPLPWQQFLMAEILTGEDRTAELCISDDICGTHNSIPPAGLYLDEVADQ